MSSGGSPGEGSTTAARQRVLVAGMGNLLRGDDGFGIEVIRRLRERADLPAGVRAVDVGMGGILLVRELLDGYELLIIVDAVSRGKPPGTLVTLSPKVPDMHALSADDLGTLIGNPRTRAPSRVLLLAGALGVLPEKTVIVGCEAEVRAGTRLALSDPVEAAVDRAADQVTALAQNWLATH